MNFKGIVIVESPFAPPRDIKDQTIRLAYIGRNLRYARAAMRWCLLQGLVPFASHLLYTQPGVLDDFDAQERALGIEAGLHLAEACATESILFVDLGISSGMEQGRERAIKVGRPVSEMSLGDDWEKWLGSTDWSRQA